MHETIPDEQWRPIPGYEDAYEVSDQGRVRSLDRVVQCVSGEIRRYRGKILKTTPGAGGYVRVALTKRDSKHSVHALVLLAFVGPPPAAQECCHGNGDRADNRLANLRYDTRSANNFDRVRHGTHPAVQRTHCPRQHPLEPPNLVPWQAEKGRRVCLACARTHSSRSGAEQRGQVFDFEAEADRRYEQIISGAANVGLPSSVRTRCPQGHPLAEPNLVPALSRKGLRGCLACSRAHGNEYSAKRSKRPFDFKSAADEHYQRIVSGTVSVLNRQKTHCPRGHLLSLPNLVAGSIARGSRGCLACDRAKGNQRYAKRRGRPFDYQAVADQHYAAIMTT